MPEMTAEATWEGGLQDGKGSATYGQNPQVAPFSFGTRFEKQGGTNPEELLGAAHAGCYSMALAAALERAGHAPNRVHTTAKVKLEKADHGFAITRIVLETDADVPGMNADQFRELAEETKRNCVVSKALAGVPIGLQANLLP
jgi:osmotically inducible protein OsmC